MRLGKDQLWTVSETRCRDEFRLVQIYRQVTHTKPSLSNTLSTGVWYEAYHTSAVYEKNLVCIMANYTVKTDKHVAVDNSGTNCKTHKNGHMIGDAKLRGAATEGKLGVSAVVQTFASIAMQIKFFWWQLRGNYDVVATDYMHALVFSCTNYFLFHDSTTWILTRSATNYDQNVVNAYIQKAVDVSECVLLGLTACAFAAKIHQKGRRFGPDTTDKL